MLVALLRTLRPKQWTKNTFVFAALVFDRQLMNPTAFLRTAAGFLLFCLLSGMVYLINDLADLEADRQHPTKRHRPLASGRLPVPVALVGLGVLFLITFPAAWALGRGFCLVALGYFLLNLAYSFALKHIPLIDVLAIAAGFLLRVQAGVSLIHVQRFSPWLYVVTSLLALFLGFGKRRAELSLLAAGAGAHRRVLDGYTIPFLDQLLVITSATTIMAYSLYTFSAPNLPSNHAMMLTIPFVTYGIFRYLYLVQVEGQGGAPEDALLSDRPLQAAILLWALSIVAIFYLY
ncbi:MAG TPA: decaprenyl-phosphate phosphoribosyltransferase [Anaerolineales bacterium]|nr:decaprenyl-phosphate phosphoribosyltransferase [Anaerolineales bacterium]